MSYIVLIFLTYKLYTVNYNVTEHFPRTNMVIEKYCVYKIESYTIRVDAIGDSLRGYLQMHPINNRN